MEVLEFAPRESSCEKTLKQEAAGGTGGNRRLQMECEEILSKIRLRCGQGNHHTESYRTS